MSSAWDSAPQDRGSSPTSSHQPRTDGNLHKSGPSSFQTTAGGAVFASPDGQAGIFSLTKISPAQAFYLTPQGQLMERFFNGYVWTYTAHPPPYPGGSLSALSGVMMVEDRDSTLQYIGCLYASDTEGRLFRAVQRYSTPLLRLGELETRVVGYFLGRLPHIFRRCCWGADLT